MPDIIVSQDQDTLVINGKSYSLSTAPRYDDQLVQQEVQSILRQLSLKDVTENLYLSVELFYVAYNGVAGAQGGTIQAEIATLQSRLALLCNECLKTMSTFQVETHSIIEQLIQTYKWLTRGNEKLAVMKLAHCSESSATMSQAAGGLAEQFKRLQVESTKARSNTIEAEASQRDRQFAAEKAEKEMVAKQKAEQANQTELVAQISDMQTLYNEAKSREELESRKALLMGMVSAVTSAIGAGLGAYAAVRNPIGALLASGSSSSPDSATMTQAKKDADDKKKYSDDAQQKLLETKDQQTEKQGKVNKLKNELERLNKKIAEKEEDASTKEEDLKPLKDQRDAKQDELATAQTELAGVNDKVQVLEKSAKDATAAYAAAGVALQNLAKSTGQMAAAAASAEESVHQEKMKYLNQKLDLEKEKRKSLVALAEYAESIKNLKAEEGDAALSVNSLHAAVEALGKIIGTLTNASLFWDQMSAYCARMSSKGFQQEIKDLTDPDAGLSAEERIREYRDPHFMMMFFNYLCQWVAVNGLSDEYVLAADQAQKKAVQYLQQSPTIDEAIRKAPELARNLEVIIGKSLQASRQATVELEQQRAVIEHAQVA